MPRNVRRWYGVSMGGNVIFRGTEAEISRFRNACHRFFRKQHEDENRRFFPDAIDGQNRYGACEERAEFMLRTSQVFKFEKLGSEVWLIHSSGASACVHPN